MIHTPSRSSTPSAKIQIAMAGSMLPKGIGSMIVTASTSEIAPSTRSALG